MKFSVGVEYAIHCLLYMVNMEDGKSIGIRDLSTFQGISETYLSKIYAKLSKSGIVKSVPGVKGGYTLARSADKITFCDIVEAALISCKIACLQNRTFHQGILQNVLV